MNITPNPEQKTSKRNGLSKDFKLQTYFLAPDLPLTSYITLKRHVNNLDPRFHIGRMGEPLPNISIRKSHYAMLFKMITNGQFIGKSFRESCMPL